MLSNEAMLLALFLLPWCFAVSKGVDSNALFPRFICFSQEQSNCNKTFLEAYPKVSRSATNLTEADTFFLLYTRANRDKPEILHKCAGNLPPNTNYRAGKRLVVILNALLFSYCDSAVFREWKTQILSKEDVNLLIVDFSWGSAADIGTTILNEFIVAKQVKILFQNLQKDPRTKLTRKMIWLMSVSLGADLAGLIGKIYKVGRITALDPANTGFPKNSKNSLSTDKADLVDVWHTNMGKCLPQLGINYDAGHFNFYINGGKLQVSCEQYAIESLLKGDLIYGISTLAVPMLCYHFFSTQYFKVSINPGCCQFVGIKCKSRSECQKGEPKDCGANGENCVIMGYDLDKYITRVPSTPQLYYVKTGLLCPYCISNQMDLGGFTKTFNKSLQNKTCNRKK